ncbi:hypothetical protein EPT53_08410 [Fusobacterium necrophorum]|uniref:Uncharacterized protein n=1 Tax=Fusobacterium necrophorum TaxID=859 RepID=A0A4Q2KWG8_9FUSO|nr:hypothetical protein [Fusobacterium necrophorum]RXZ68910.1 hypothetical protein EPT53_08410 [Fusobacterium necrophorum]
MKKQILVLEFFLFIFSLYADSYYKEEGRAEDGSRYVKETWTRESKETKTERKLIVPIEKRGSSADVDLGVFYNLAKKEAKAREKAEKKYEALWKEAIQEKNDISDLKWEETMDDLEEIEEGAMEE